MKLSDRRHWNMWGLALVTLLLLAPFSARAVDIPPSGTNVYIQTSGPNTPLSVGDYYNSVTGGNRNERDNNTHLFQVLVPCAWDANRTLTFSLFDPEINPNPRTDPIPNTPITLDEIRYENDEEFTNGRGNLDTRKASVTNFTLTTPNGTRITRTYTPEGGTNGLWIELVTFTPGEDGYGCGMYELTTNSADTTLMSLDPDNNPVSQDNDDNAWVLRVANDADCSVSTAAPGTCSTPNRDTALLLSNGNERDDFDRIPGTGDEIVIGLVRSSFQQAAEACQNFYAFVDARTPAIAFYNFDMDLDIELDNPQTINVTYFPPQGSTRAPITGTASSNKKWNSANPPPPYATGPGGDSIAVTPQDVGWWRAQVCINIRNQYIFQGPENTPIFFTQPPTPVMALGKSDGVALVQSGQVLTYTIAFTNTSNTTPTPGVANNVVLTDTLDAGTTYMSCAINVPYTGTCSETGGLITFRLTEGVNAGASGSVQVAARVRDDIAIAPAPATTLITNTVRMDYQDELGNQFGPVFASDTDEVRPKEPRSPTAITLARLTAVRVDGVAVVRWITTGEQNTWGFNVLRSDTRQRIAARRVSERTVLAHSRGAGGGAYEWRDTTLVPGAQPLYWLQEIETDGTTREYGPVQLVDEQRLFMPLITR